MKLIVGMGNPGPEYDGTRHNAGALAVAAYAERHDAVWKKHRGHALIATYKTAREHVVLMRPTRYMNDAGIAVGALARFFGAAAADIILVYDDLDVPFGSLRVSINKTSGGHNGVRSVIEQLGSSDMMRVRIGIGPKRGDAAAFVLRPWSARERQLLDTVTLRACSALETLLQEGMETAARNFNRKKPS